MDTSITVGQKYKHFRNNRIYEIVGIAKNTEDNNQVVVYRCLTTNEMYVRPIWQWVKIWAVFDALN
jgi:hypothetical protein